MAQGDHIETNEAEMLRSQRQHFAAPGGFHDALVAFLGKALPMMIGVLAAFMVIVPLSPRGEVSFLLDRNKVALVKERLRVENAMYRGQDSSGRPFSLSAGLAAQRSSAEGVVRMENLVAWLMMDDGPARVSAGGGSYAIREKQVRFLGPAQMSSADGYAMSVDGIVLDLDKKQMTGTRGVTGKLPAGSFSANRLIADLPARRVVLDGNAHLTMYPRGG